MKINDEIKIVLSVYSGVKEKMWSKTAKRILGIHLFGDRSLTSGWELTLRKWLNEMSFIENHYGPIPMLDANFKTFDQFFQEVVNILFSKGCLTSMEHKSMTAGNRLTQIIKPENTYAQAIIVKVFFEASLNRNWGKKFGSFKRTSIYSDELFSQPLSSLLQGRVEDQLDLDKRFMDELDGVSEYER